MKGKRQTKEEREMKGWTDNGSEVSVCRKRWTEWKELQDIFLPFAGHRTNKYLTSITL